MRDFQKPRHQATAAIALGAMVLSSLTPLLSEPAHPAWWNARGVKSTNAAQNLGVANLGQLKHIANQAHAELESLLPSGAGYSQPFPDVGAGNYSALNLGQLKAVAKPLYDRLNAIAPNWVKDQLEANGLSTLGTHYFQDANTGYYYPWNPTTPASENYKVATLGQLKLVFSLRIGENLDGDGAEDLIELEAFGTTAYVVSAVQAQQLQQSGATTSSDSDGDGLSNAQEVLLGSEPLITDSDNDGLADGQDADPADKAVAWARAPQTTYLVIELGTPANEGTIDNTWGLALGDGGHVVMSKELAWAGGSGAPGKELFKTYAWSLGTQSWSGLLQQADNLRGIGKQVDADGNIYSRGFGALGPNDSGPGIKEVVFRWGKSTSGWNEAQTVGAAGLGSSFSDEIDTWTAFPPLFTVPLNLFGESGLFLWQGTHGPGTGSTSAFRHGTNNNAAFLTATTNQNVDEQITAYKQAGEPGGWHAAVWEKTATSQQGGTPVVTEGYIFGHLLADQSIQSYTAPIGAARKSLTALSAINSELLPDGVLNTVVWSVANGLFQVGKVDAAGITWQESNKSDSTKRLGGKINALGEGLLNTKLWRNGQWLTLDDMVTAESWSNIRGVDINSDGLILAKADKVGTTSETDKLVILIPVEVAPEVLAVNSDFDEGRIDPATGYAIPDCDDVPGVDRKSGAGNDKLEIETKREHLDALYANNERVTGDMHKGWFGVNPTQLGDDFWDGATVTIRKLDKDDPDTDRKESGQVRFYAKWGDPKFGTYYAIIPYDLETLAPNNLVTSGVNGKPGEGVYGSTSTIPDDAQFWIEGVRPGKITLEWRYQKGAVDLKYEQTFLVATQKSKEAWQEEISYQIRLKTSVGGQEVDVRDFDPSNEYLANTKYIKEVYEWYAETFVKSEDDFIWSGMAKMAGAPVYAALSDAQVGRNVGPGIGIELVSKNLQQALMGGNLDIFLDLAWQHKAYEASGIWALKYVNENDDDNLPLESVAFEDWVRIDRGVWEDSFVDISLGAKELLRREQLNVVSPVYVTITALNLDEIISVLAENPIPNFTPLGKTFRETVNPGNLANFNDRWYWIENDMVPGWTGVNITYFADFDYYVTSSSGGYSAAERVNKASIPLKTRAAIYATFANQVP